MRRVLIDDKLEEEFQREGFVKIDFIGEKEVEYLKNKFFELLPSSGGLTGPEDFGVKASEEIPCDIDFTFIDKSVEFKQMVYDTITEVFVPFADKVLENYRPIIANYIRKKKGTGEVCLHEDWTFVDESKASTVSIWCPLVDMTMESLIGTLQFVPGSHKKFGKVRGPMVPWELEEISNEIIKNDLVPRDMKAGQAVILDNSLLHYSDVNKTDNLRLAIQLIMMPKGMQCIHHHMNPADPNKVNVLEVDNDFFMSFNPWKQPENPKIIESFTHVPYQMTYKEFKKKLHEKRSDEEGGGLLNKLKTIFN